MVEARCPSCGYTERDARELMDHRYCKNDGNAPWQRRKRSESEALMRWKEKHPNLANRPGWDERDYKLWSDIQQLPSYGLSGCTKLVSVAEVVELLERHAKGRFNANCERKSG